ncbi:MAG: P1 family peptidase, partial [Candidatus Rokuibacteriota bacterium]
ASVGKVRGVPCAMRGGIGSASVRLEGATVGALVCVNAVGDVRDPDTGALIAGTREAAGSRRLADSAALLRSGAGLTRFGGAQHTTIGVVATDAHLDKAEAAGVAAFGMLGFARALSPPATAFDGDALFALSVGAAELDVTRVGMAAAEAVAVAIVRAVRAATGLPDLPAARDLL